MNSSSSGKKVPPCSLVPVRIWISSAESEIFSATEAMKDLTYLRLMLSEMGYLDTTKPSRLYEDNKACIQLGAKVKSISKARHYILRLRWLQEKIEQGEYAFTHCPTDEMIADVLTKPLPREKFLKFKKLLLGIPFDITN